MYVKNKGNETQNSSFPIISSNFAVLMLLRLFIPMQLHLNGGSGTQACMNGVLTHRCA